MSRKSTISRRGLLAAGGGIAAAAAVGMPMPGWAAPAAAVPTGPFDLTAPSNDLFVHKKLYHVSRVMQSFAFDNKNRRLFVAQLQPNKTRDADAYGDLCINQMDFHGTWLGHMHINDCGHGVSFGVEAVGSESVLWIEADSKKGSDGHGWGTKIGRTPYVKSKTMSSADIQQKFLPVAGSDHVTCASDPYNKRMLVRYLKDGAFHYALYNTADLTSAQSGATPLYSPIKQPGGLGTFQGYTVYGNYLYMLTGDPCGSDENDKCLPGKDNARVHSVDLRTGGSYRSAPTKAGLKRLAYHREPEGMAVYVTKDGEPRLFLGFASGKKGGRVANIFYKNHPS